MPSRLPGLRAPVVLDSVAGNGIAANFSSPYPSSSKLISRQTEVMMLSTHPPTSSAAGQAWSCSNVTIERYFSRHLRLENNESSGCLAIVDEDGLLAIAGPKVILGEPGMGKSQLIEELGRRLDVRPISAQRFIASGNPGRFHFPGKPLLIDGLDEAMARRDSDAVDMVLGKLEDAGHPDFILCCRSREWQSRNVVNLAQIYGSAPSILTIEAFTRFDAFAFMRQLYPELDVDHVLDHLEDQGIAELYHNPLTLSLIGKVAVADRTLPATRGGLFERVCILLWPEHDPHRIDGALGLLSEEQALSAAGALCAGLLLASGDAISRSGPNHLVVGDVRLAELSELPEAEAAQAVFSSKLFQTVGPERAKPIHRVVAEFLGARWLSKVAITTQAQKRVLAQFRTGGSVPASLRGLHAWLSYHSQAMSSAVIAADPYGVLRYGETANLTAEQAQSMLDALTSLSQTDPFFRSQDWGSHKASGLMHDHLVSKIETIITSPDSNVHLRALLIEGLTGTPLARSLEDALDGVVFSDRHAFSERKHAVQALLPSCDRARRQSMIDRLHQSYTDVSFELALFVIEANDFDVSDELLAMNILACSGLYVCSLPRASSRTSGGVYWLPFSQKLALSRIPKLLSLLTEQCVPVDFSETEPPSYLVGLIALLISRVITENVLTDCPEDAALLWNWLGAIHRLDLYDVPERKTLNAHLDNADDLRHAVQQYVLHDQESASSVWSQNCDLEDRLLGLASRKSDLLFFLERLALFSTQDEKARAQWCDLMLIACRNRTFDPDVRAVSRKFQRDDSELEAYVYTLENPGKSEHAIQRELRQAKRIEALRVQYEADRDHYLQHRSSLRNGDLREILLAASYYLGHHDVYDVHLNSVEVLTAWLGAEFADDAIVGFEAVLHRDDLPSPHDVAHSPAEEKMWNYSLPMVAGLLARLRAGEGFSDIQSPVLLSALIACLHNQITLLPNDLSSLCEALENELFGNHDLPRRDTLSRYDFAWLCLEPCIKAGKPQISAMNAIFSQPQWHATAALLSAAWLSDQLVMGESVENRMIHLLVAPEHLHEMGAIAKLYSDVEFSSVSRMLMWRAVDFLVSFNESREALAVIGKDDPDFIWPIIRLVPGERRGQKRVLDTAQVKWIVSNFRGSWPRQNRPWVSDGSKSPFEAASFVRSMIQRLADDTSIEAIEALQELIAEPEDSYTLDLLHMAAEQRQKRAEEDFAPLQPGALSALLREGPPTNMVDLRALVLDELSVIQKKLLGDDLDRVSVFWGDNGVPYVENICRDRFAMLISRELEQFGIRELTEADMPKSKRVDLAFACGDFQIPIEIKCQWHDEVWQGATHQLHDRYLIDWRSHGCGIYLVFWFGELPSNTGKRLQVPPSGVPTPRTPEAMRLALIECLPEALRSRIDVVVIDLEAGRTSLTPRI